jgi:hypothetical protein
VTVSADASSGYLVSPASNAVSPQLASSQYDAPVITSLSSGGGNGGNYHFTVNFTEAGAAPTNDYTVKACTNSAMTGASCVFVSNVTGTGYQLTGLTHTGYFFTVEANAAANSSYASNTSAVYPSGSTGDTP